LSPPPPPPSPSIQTRHAGPPSPSTQFDDKLLGRRATDAAAAAAASLSTPRHAGRLALTSRAYISYNSSSSSIGDDDGGGVTESVLLRK